MDSNSYLTMTKLFLEPQEPRFAVKNYPFRGIKSQKHEKSVATSKKVCPYCGFFGEQVGNM